MRKHTICLMWLVGLITLTAWTLPARAVAEEGAGGEKKERKVRREGKDRPEGKGRPEAKAKMEEALKQAGLTEEDIKKVHEIMKANAEKVQAAAKADMEKHKALMEKAKAAKEAGDKEAMKAVAEERKKMMDARKTNQEEVQKQIAAAIGEEKAKKVAEVMKKQQEQMQHMRIMNALNLTDDQKAKLAEARKKADAADSPEAGHKIMQEALASILTDEQKEKMKKMTAGRRPGGPEGGPKGPFGNIELTDEQKAKLAEARKKADAADSPEAKRKIMQEARDNILTDEQKAKIKEARKGRNGGEGKRGERKRKEGDAE